ncbi:MAG: hypothetical protein MUP64_16490 [Anaerolineae bacterium]|nr:hypothetical protein [Anaerolineae bacterium]
MREALFPLWKIDLYTLILPAEGCPGHGVIRIRWELSPSAGAASRVAGLIYGADLTGACFGALLSSVFLIPILGIPQTCYAVAMLALTGLVLLLL